MTDDFMKTRLQRQLREGLTKRGFNKKWSFQIRACDDGRLVRGQLAALSVPVKVHERLRERSARAQRDVSAVHQRVTITITTE